MAETARPKIILDDGQIKAQLDELTAKSRKLKEALTSAVSSNADFTTVNKLKKELNSVNSQIRSLRKETVDVDRVLANLGGSSLANLEKVRNKLKSEIKVKVRGSEEWDDLKTKINAVDKEISSVYKSMNSGAAKGTSGYLNHLAKLTAGAIGAVTAFSSLKGMITKYAEQARELEDRKLNLQSMTGVSDADAEYFVNQSKMLSQTSKDGVKITETAQNIVDAYTLMGSKRPELLKSKEDLAAVTKEALVLSAASKDSAQASTEAVAMAMNQFGATSEEAKKYINVLAAGSQAGAVAVPQITESIAKMGPAAKAVGMNIEQTVAIIETLGEKGIEGAEAGTQLKNVLLTLGTGADEFNPKIVGMQTAFENLAKANMSSGELLAKFGKESYTAASILIDSVPKLGEYEKAVTGTNTAYEQAALNTSGAKATMAQLKNEFENNAMTLASKFQPALIGAWKAGNSLIKIIGQLPNILATLAPAITGATIAWVAYEMALAKVTIAQKLLSVWNNTVVSGLNKIKVMFATNPATMWIAAIGLLVTAVLALKNAFGKVNEVRSKFIADTNTERSALNNDFEALKKTTQGTEDRKKAIELLNKKYGEYLPHLLSEKSTLKDIEAAQDAATKAMLRNLAVKAKKDEMNELMSDKSEAITKKLKYIYQKAESEKGEVAANLLMQRIGDATDKFKGDYAKLDSELKKIILDQGWSRMIYTGARQIGYDKRKIDDGMSGIEKYYSMYTKVMRLGNLNPPKVKTGNDASDDVTSNSPDVDAPSTPKKLSADDKFEKEKSALEIWMREQQAMYKQMYLSNKLSKANYDKEMLALEITQLMRLKALQKKYKKDTTDIDNSILDKKISEKEKADSRMIAEEKEFQDTLNDITKDADKDLLDMLKKHGKSKEENAKKNWDEIQKEEEDSNARINEQRQKEYDNFMNISNQFAQSFGDTMYQFMTDQEMSTADFACALLEIGLDSLHNVVKIAIAQITAKSIAESGWYGLIKAAALSVVIEGAFAVAKAALKRPTAQRAEGKYDVLAMDGNTYSADVVENPGTGIFTRPTLFAEKGDELIVDGKTLSRIKMKAPEIITKINDFRVPQRAAGNYDNVKTTEHQAPQMTQMMALLDAQNKVIDKLNKRLEHPIDSVMSFSNFERQSEKVEAIRKAARR